jgi:multiple sugar transport system substrate-binding protein
MKKRSIALGLLAMGVLVVTAGCSSGGTAPSNGKVTLDWTMWAGSDAETGAWQHVADLVHQKDPNITVKLKTAAWPDYWTKLPTVLAGNNVPCIVGLQMGYVPAFATSFPALDGRLDKAGIKLSDFDPTIVKSLSVGGKVLAIPYDYGPYIVFYNKDAFKAAGITEPQNGWKLAEFEADAKKLTSGSQYGFAVNNSIDAMQQWAPTISGAQAVTNDNKLDVNNSNIEKTLSWYSGLVNKEKVAQPLAATATADAGAAFLGGNAAMYVDGPWSLINAKAQAKFNVGVVTIPAGDSGLKTTSGGSGFGLSSKCTNPDEAMKAISIITSAESLDYLASVGRAWPSRPANQASFYPAAPAGSQATLELAASSVLPYKPTATWAQDSRDQRRHSGG